MAANAPKFFQSQLLATLYAFFEYLVSLFMILMTHVFTHIGDDDFSAFDCPLVMKLRVRRIEISEVLVPITAEDSYAQFLDLLGLFTDFSPGLRPDLAILDPLFQVAREAAEVLASRLLRRRRLNRVGASHRPLCDEGDFFPWDNLLCRRFLAS